jgi:hypothetical protein
MECPVDFTHEEDGSCCGVCTKTIVEPIDTPDETNSCDNVNCIPCPSDFTHEDDGTCCGICKKFIVDEPEYGCDAVSCMDCPAGFTH